MEISSSGPRCMVPLISLPVRTDLGAEASVAAEYDFWRKHWSSKN